MSRSLEELDGDGVVEDIAVGLQPSEHEQRPLVAVGAVTSPHEWLSVWTRAGREDRHNGPLHIVGIEAV